MLSLLPAIIGVVDLRVVGERLAAATARDCLVARLGGDEFVIALSRDDRDSSVSAQTGCGRP